MRWLTLTLMTALAPAVIQARKLQPAGSSCPTAKVGSWTRGEAQQNQPMLAHVNLIVINDLIGSEHGLPCVHLGRTLDGRNRMIVTAESLSRVIVQREVMSPPLFGHKAFLGQRGGCTF